MNLSTYSNIWSILESLLAFSTFTFSIVVFFSDPVRRWRFFGFRPTALIVLYDPKIKKVLLTKHVEGWEFNQGGIYESNILATVEQIVSRELGLDSNLYKLYYVKALGKSKIVNDKYRLQRSTIGGITIARTLQGKGYVGCFVTCNLKKVFPKIKLSHELYGKKLVSFDQAQEIIGEWQMSKKPQKLKINLKALQIAKLLVK